MEENKSALAVAIEARTRKVYEFEVHGFFALGNKSIHKIGIQVANKAEQDSAANAANLRMKSLTTDEDARRDPDIVTDIKNAEILFRVCRRAEPGDADRSHMYPAFPSPEWMRNNMTTDQYAVLMNLYDEVLRKESPIKRTVDFEQVDTLAAVCGEAFNSDVPEAVLAPCTREWLSTAFALLSLRLKESRASLDTAIKALKQAEEANALRETGPVGSEPGAPGSPPVPGDDPAGDAAGGG